MKLLLDTHSFLWFILDDKRLIAEASSLMSEPNNDLLLSPATYWEIAIKISLGKYTLPEPFAVFMEEQIARNDLLVLPVTLAHAAVVTTLPFHHRDPFDRLLVSQAIVEEIPLLSADSTLDEYAIKRLW